MVRRSDGILSYKRHSPAGAKGLTADPQDGRRLETLKLSPVDQVQYPLYECLFKPEPNDLSRALFVFDILE